MSGPQIKSRKPTCVIPVPLVLLEGEEKAGKSWAAMLLSASPKVGATYVLDLGEGGADEYGLIPGANFEILEHDGTWAEILERVAEVKAAARYAKDNGQPPVVLVIDSATDLWNGLKGWVDERFKRSDTFKRLFAKDPNGEHKATQNLWNDANARHRRLMTQLMTFPGVVVLTARGKEVTEVKNGKPVEGSKIWSVTAQQDVPFDATVWVRMFRNAKPLVVGCRNPYVGVRPGKDEPVTIEAEPENLLEWLIFDAMRVDPTVAQVRDLKHTTGGELTEDERADEAATENPQRVRRFKSREEQRDDERSGLAPEEIARRDALNAVLDAAREAKVAPALVAKEWADAHDGQDIRQATDVGALELLADDLRARAEAKAS
jgi:hypothetical protein